MKYQTAKAIWFPTQSAACFVKSRSYAKTVGLYGPSDRYVQFFLRIGKSNTKIGNLVIVKPEITIHQKTKKSMENLI